LPPPALALFPYPTLFRSQIAHCRPRQQLGSDHERVLVDVERGAVVRRGFRPGRRRAHEGERARDAREEEGHVLAAHCPYAVNHTDRKSTRLNPVTSLSRM